MIYNIHDYIQYVTAVFNRTNIRSTIYYASVESFNISDFRVNYGVLKDPGRVLSTGHTIRLSHFQGS